MAACVEPDLFVLKNRCVCIGGNVEEVAKGGD